MVNKKNKCNVLDIANWFLWKNSIEQSENVTEYDEYEVYENLTHLKLQKLVYFAQGIYLAFTGNSLFSDKIMAWEHGPVVKKLYDEFKKYKRNDIDKKLSTQELQKISELELDDNISTVLNFVYQNFGVYTAWQLRELSHEKNGPWEVTVRQSGMNKEIPKKNMESYFQKYIKKDA